MKKLLLFIFLFYSSFLLRAQEELSVSEWQKNNSDVVFIEKNDASNELIEKLDSKGIKYIIFNNDVQESDILNFTNQNSLKKDYYQFDGFSVRTEEAQFVKNWFSTHTDIKVLTKSAVANFSNDQIEFYRSIDALILDGEIITMQDLKNYENEH
ncbi:MAG: hypothetical protein ACK479_14620 [Fluviicola sp.]